MTNRDSFVLTRGNVVCHQPWQCFYLIRDKEEMKDKQILNTDDMKPDEPVDSNNKKPIEEKTESNPYTDNQFFGPWYTYKTTHCIMINNSPKNDTVPQMFERLQMVKPWEIAPVPAILKK